MPHFTTKINKHTGQYGWIHAQSADIKRKRKKVGYIMENRQQNVTYAHFAIAKEPTKESPAPFYWVRLSKAFKTFDEALNHVRKMEKPAFDCDLYVFED